MLTSSHQRRLINAENFSPGLYNVCFYANLRINKNIVESFDKNEYFEPNMYLKNDVDESRVEFALRQLILRHDILRTYFNKKQEAFLFSDVKIDIKRITLLKTDLEVIDE